MATQKARLIMDFETKELLEDKMRAQAVIEADEAAAEKELDGCED